MWNSINETLSDFCSSTFWDTNLTWNSPNPDFSVCFEKTILTWIPCVFLWLCLPVEIRHFRRTGKSEIPINLYDILKLIAIGTLIVTSLFDISTYNLIDTERSAVDIYTPVIKFLTFGLFCCLKYACIKRGTKSSGTHFVFSFLLVLCGAAQFRTELKSFYGSVITQDWTHSISYTIYYVAALVVLYLHCFTDVVHSANKSHDEKAWPETYASFLSKLIFAWFDALIRKGYKRPLTEDDLWNLDENMRTAQIARKFERRWRLALNRVKDYPADDEDVGINDYEDDINGRLHSRKKEASIMRPLVEIFGSYFTFSILLKSFSCIVTILSTAILNLILVFVADDSEPLWHGYFYAFLMLIATLSQTLFHVHHYDIMIKIGLQIQTALISVAYKKTLKISSGVRRDFAYGEIVNIMAVDAQRFVQVLFYVSLVWAGALEVCLSVYFLWNIFGIWIVVGVALLIIFTLMSVIIISKIQNLQMKQMKFKDDRVKLLNEILSGIRVLKMYACEPSFEKRVTQIRNTEIEILKGTAYLQAASAFLWICAPFLVALTTFGLYVLFGENHALNPQITFVSLSLFKVMQFSMRVLPGAVTAILQAYVAVKRINKFLNAEELNPRAVSHEKLSVPIIVENGNFSWEGYRGLPTLRNINVKVQHGSLVAIVGPVGSGKSSLLSALLGEMYKQSGFVNISDKLAYVPQQAWIQNTTVECNITFGDTTNGSFYKTVLEACALIPDLKILPGGDQSEIGEKGANLSGGQKQRVSLARAVYSEADTYLLDDPLSAVDAHVRKHLFEKVIGPKGLLRKKTRIFVTHDLSYLSQCDYIIVLQDGMISESGTYEELLKKEGNFANFLATYSSDIEKDDPAEPRVEMPAQSECEHSLVRSTSESEKCTEEIKSSPHKLTENEEMQIGNVKWSVIGFYLKAMDRRMVALAILCFFLYAVFSVTSDYWLSAWSSSGGRNGISEQYMYLGGYALFVLGIGGSVVTQTFSVYLGMLKAARYLHNHLLSSVLRWPAITFDKIPCGRIVNRFGSDIDVLDNLLSRELVELVAYVAIGISSLFVISYSSLWFLCVLLPIAAVYYIIQRIYAASTKQLQRMESASKSKIYSHFGDTILGGLSIRAYRLQTKFIKSCALKIDENLKMYCPKSAILSWLLIRLEFLGAYIVFSASIFAVLNRSSISVALIALPITYALQIIKYLTLWAHGLSLVETYVVSIERIKEYSEVEQEAPRELPADETVSSDWPDQGTIVFDQFQFRYQENLEPVLKDLSFKVNGGEKVGIVGRTGAGKSSLTLSLFRLVEASGGKISIDNVDISSIGLHTLRSRLTIIPQDPVLFVGTLRMNLDPSEKYSDEQVWKALELTNLKPNISSLSGGLQYQIDEGGGNFSVGQRQLICLTRALLRKTKILILDEATAAVDLETDNLIQTTIRREFKNSTILTIAHRLNTVLDYDRIMVLDKGRIAEFDSPTTLLQDTESVLYSMATDAGLANTTTIERYSKSVDE